METNKLFLTGGSGLLGRSINREFKNNVWTTYPVAFSRAKEDFIKLDIRDEEAVCTAIKDCMPNFIIHCAAVRYPDVVDKNPEAAKVLNVDATANIIKVAGYCNIPVLYISTDYVFDGRTPPYKTTDEPNPLNIYGKTKLEGEKVVLTNSNNIVLRVPVLYGPVEVLDESAVTCLLTPLVNTHKPASISHTEWRCPSHVDDIAHICFNMASAKIKGKKLSGIFHWCGDEKLTKYEMVMKMSEVFNLPHSHISANLNPGTSTVRPKDTELDKTTVKKLGFGKHTLFEVGIRQVLTPWIKQ
uniref:Methionine adenosyltransferase 2 subunit beta n=1 Tax=Clastoptera arizonana TaxID=38151 RepID=A0A1B6EB48_9HEMI